MIIQDKCGGGAYPGSCSGAKVPGSPLDVCFTYQVEHGDACFSISHELSQPEAASMLTATTLRAVREEMAQKESTDTHLYQPGSL